MSRIVKYYKGARERTKRRKSPWNWILLPLSVIGILGMNFVITKGLIAIQHQLVPVDAILSGQTPTGGFLMFVLTIFPSLPLGLIFANLVAWCIPPARRAFENEAKGVKGHSFKEAIKTLSIVSIILLVIIMPLSFLGAFNYFYITPEGITINPLFSIKEKKYMWSDIVRIHAECLIERNNFHKNYIVYMKDGIKIDLCSGQPFKFIDIYDRIKPFIKSHPQIKYDYSLGEKEMQRLKNSPSYGEKLIKIIRNE